MNTLIEDTGIQFITVSFEIDISELSTQYYVQNRTKNWLDNTHETTLEHGVKIDDSIFSLKILAENKCLTPAGKVDESSINWSEIEYYNEDDIIVAEENSNDYIDRIIRVNDIKECLELFSHRWLPCPFFNYQQNLNKREFTFGPIAWCRMKIFYNKVEEEISKNRNKLEFKAVFAFDTLTANGEQESAMPLITKKNRRLFKIPEGDAELLNFTSKFDWIKDNIKAKSNAYTFSKQKPLDHIAKYLYLVSLLATHKDSPMLELFPHTVGERDDVVVDFVLDIGNSRTCGLLFESNESNSVDFEKMEKLKLVNLNNPFEVTQDPFDMRLVLSQEKFGDIIIPEYDDLFHWPSVVRLGREAKFLLNKYDIANHSRSETLNTMSSPKRYLWDTNSSKQPWEFIKSKEEYAVNPAKEEVSYKHLTYHLTEEGVFSEEFTPNARAHYSKSSMMVFAAVEILLHAYTQINSDSYRTNKGKINSVRRLRNVILTCPTAMTKEEQLKMKISVENAIKLLDNFYFKLKEELNKLKPQSNGFNFSDFQELPSLEEGESNLSRTSWSSVKVVPSSKDIAYNDNEYKEKVNWVFDEATTSQMVFIYGQIARKYKNNFDKYFDVYGKSINGKKSLTVAGLDIGGGTSDFMICEYKMNESNKSTLTPDPRFWETFNVAGDEIVRMIIQQILIDGQSEGTEFDADAGILKYYALKSGVKDVTDRIVLFFGEHFISNQHNIYKRSVTNQLLVPIALKFLSFLSESTHLDNQEFKFEEIFSSIPPNPDLINYTNRFFGGDFNFMEIKWIASRKKLNQVIAVCFSKLLQQISIITSAMEADLILLSGRPSAIPHIRDILINFMPMTPDRIISISNFNIGSWCPSHVKGVLKDAKTTVATGAMIYLLGGKQIGDIGMSINTSLLKQKLISSANNVGIYNSYQNSISHILLDEFQEKTMIRVDQFPFELGVKQLKHHSYPARKIFNIVKNRTYVRDRLLKRSKYKNLPETELVNMVEERFASQYDVQLLRKLKEDKEKIEIIRIVNAENGEEMDVRHLKLELVTLDDEKGYWLDHGIFVGLNKFPVN